MDLQRLDLLCLSSPSAQAVGVLHHHSVDPVGEVPLQRTHRLLSRLALSDPLRDERFALGINAAPGERDVVDRAVEPSVPVTV